MSRVRLPAIIPSPRERGDIRAPELHPTSREASRVGDYMVSLSFDSLSSLEQEGTEVLTPDAYFCVGGRVSMRDDTR